MTLKPKTEVVQDVCALGISSCFLPATSSLVILLVNCKLKSEDTAVGALWQHQQSLRANWLKEFSAG